MSKKVILSVSQIDEMQKMLDNDMSIRKIAKNFNVSPEVITRIIKENNLRREITNLDILQHKLNGYQELEQQICGYYRIHKMTLKEVGDKFGIGPQSVERILHSYNVQRLSAGDFTRKYHINEKYFSVIDSSKKAYFLGLLYADGCMTKDRYIMQISLQEEDMEILEKMRIDMELDRPLIYRKPPKKFPHRKPQYLLSIQNKSFCEHLVNQGVVPNKSYVAKFPERLPEEYYISFIRGVYDGDGCLYHYEKRNTNTITFTGTSELINSIGDIIEKELGIKKHIHLAQNSIKIDKNTRVLMFGGNKQVKRFLDWLYKDADIYLERKFRKYCDLYNVNNSLAA